MQICIRILFRTGQIIKRTAFFIQRTRFADIRSKAGEEFQESTCCGREKSGRLKGSK
jgi:hypothetical protein